jgi:hypothetical protein
MMREMNAEHVLKVIGASVLIAAAIGVTCWINYDASLGLDLSSKAGTVAMTLAATLAWAVFFSERPRDVRVFALCVFVFFSGLNFISSSGSVASMNDRAHDTAQNQNDDKGNQKAALEDLKGRRASLAKKITDGDTAKGLEAQIAALKAAGGNGGAKWEGHVSTEHCDPAHTTTENEKAFCRQIAALENGRRRPKPSKRSMNGSPSLKTPRFPRSARIATPRGNGLSSGSATPSRSTTTGKSLSDVRLRL